MGVIYEVYGGDWLRLHDMIHDDHFRNSNNIKGNTSTNWEAVVLVTTNERYLYGKQLKWTQVAWWKYKDSWISS
jgi:hypothetical protein